MKKNRANNLRQFRSLSWPMLVGLLFALVVGPATQASTVATNLLLPGTRFATECYIQDSGQPGKTVMIVGGAHGNEPAGAQAAEAISRWHITAGKLVVIPRANVPSLTVNKRLIPNLDTNLNNLNRNYPRAGKSEGARGELAQAIWKVALEQKPDWLLDLHEGYDFNQLNEKSVGSSVIVFPDAQGPAAAELMLAAVNKTITDEKLKFARRGPPIDGSLARAGGEHLHIPAMTLETTSKQPMAKRVSQHETMVHALLAYLNMVDGVPTRILATDSMAGPAATRIALYKGPGTGGNGPPNLLARLNTGTSTSITEVSPEQIRGGVLSNYDVAIFAGGSGSKQAEALGETGRAAVQKFVGEGGGYIGICAGAYLATTGYPWSLGLINARTISPKWQRGRGNVKLELTEHGRSIIDERTGQFDCVYHNGPIVKPDTKEGLPPIDVLAWFRTEFAENGTPAGIMVDSPAIYAGTYKRGQVICVSPHPEQTAGLEEFIPHAVNWVTAKDKSELKKATPNAE